MKKIFLTVDTECHNIDKVNQYIYGKVNGKEYGLKLILDLARELDITVNFFLDVVEARKYGDEHIRKIVQMIQSYGQPIFLHLHPDFLLDCKRSYLWEYSHEELRKIISDGIADYKKFVKNGDGKIIFRAGRYGVAPEVYEVLAENKISLDLSYGYHMTKMCHISDTDITTANIPVMYKKVLLLPNTRYIGLDYGRVQKFFNLDTSESTTNEFSRFIRKTRLKNVVWTMHSWNFILKFFFCKNKIFGNSFEIKKFKKCVSLAKSHGFQFANLETFQYIQDEDEILNLCTGMGKLASFFNNFVRFQKIGFLNPKFFCTYLFFYLLAALLLAAVIILIYHTI